MSGTFCPDYCDRLARDRENLLAALKDCLVAINPPDRGGISLYEWNQRLKAATINAEAAIAKATNFVTAARADRLAVHAARLDESEAI